MAKKKTKKKAQRKKPTGRKDSPAPKGVKHLVIVESPNKKGSIRRILGDDYIVMASSGHFRSLYERTPFREPPGKEIFPDHEDAARDVAAFLKMFPAKAGSDPMRPETNTARYLGVDRQDGAYIPIYRITNYRVIPNIVEVIRDRLGKGSRIYLATDPDREGEGIAWHLREEIQAAGISKSIQFRRIRFHAIARREIDEAMEAAEKDLNHGFVAAYQAREVLDRLIGYPASRALWAMNLRGPGNRGLSLGRVQFAAMDMLLTDEEKALQQLPSITHKVQATARAQGQSFPVTLTLDTPIEDEAQVKSWLESQPAVVADYHQETRNFWPRAPFKTSTYQADMNRYHGVKADTALKRAQTLFECGECTYIRTDSEEVSGAGAFEIKKMVSDMGFTDRGHVRSGKKGKNAQEGHEALRPKNHDLAEMLIRSIKNGEDFSSSGANGWEAPILRAFELIFRRATAAAMEDAEGDSRTVLLNHAAVPGEQFEGVSLKLLKTGFYDVWRYENPETAHEVPRLKPGEKVKLSEVEFVSSARSAPRASASSLIMRMDKAGIGRPSSNGKLLETLEDRGYVKQGMSRFGMYVTMLAREGLGETLNLDTTQRMEEALQELLDTPQKVLDDRTFEALDSFYQPFAKRLDYLRNIGAQFGRDAGNVRGFLDKVHYKKVSGIYGISEKEDADLQGALEACRPGFFRPWGSVSYFGRALPDHTGVFVCFWWRDHPKQKQRDLVGRLYYLFQDREGNPMTMMVSMLGTSNEEIPGMLDRLDWAAKKVMGRPVMGYPEAWGAFIGILRESQRQEMRLVFDPDGSFPILNRADGRNTVHALVFGASNTD